MSKEQWICAGCTKCCDYQALSLNTFQRVEQTHPGWLQLLGMINEKTVRVKCRKAKPGFGCLKHPSGNSRVDRRPSFCKIPDPRYCGHGTKIQA